jgi:signal transduction histidine kinase
MFGGAPGKIALLYSALGLMAPLIALAYREGGPYAVAAFFAPLAVVRMTALQAERLKEAAYRLSLKNQALRHATESAGAERRDERLVIAGEIHDEVLPPLFKVHLMGQVLRRDIETGRLLELDQDLPELLTATDAAQEAIRALVNDLRRSPLGLGGLVPTLGLLVRQLDASSAPTIRSELGDVRGSQVTQLIAYQVVREALTNACKYSRASHVDLRLWSDDGLLRVVVSDNGIGFDASQVDGSQHFGLQLMKERVEAAGGRVVVDSVLGEGTTIAVSLPPDL